MSTDVDTITDERIAGIADRMVEEGRHVSPLTIRAEIAGGSMVAIAAALQRWREAKQPVTPHVQIPAEMPQDIAGTMMSAADRLWMAAQGEADRAVSQRVSALNQHLDAARTERDEALAEYQTTAEEVEAGRERQLALTNALSASEQTATHLAEELATATGRADAAETRVEELVQRVSTEEAALEHTKVVLDEERKAREELAAVALSKDDEIARMTLELNEARQEVIAVGYDCQAKSAEADKWSEVASEASARAEAATAQANESLARVAGLEAERDEARTELAAERQTSAARSEEALIQFDELQRVSRELEAAREQIGGLVEAKAAASAELAQVSQDVSAAKERADAAELRATQLEQRLVEVEQAKAAEAERWSQEVSAASSRVEAATAQASESLARVGALEAELGEAREQISAVTAAKTAAVAELAQVSLDVSAAKERADAAEQRATQLELRLVEVEQAKAAEAERWSRKLVQLDRVQKLPRRR